MVLLLLIHYLMFLPLFVGVWCLSLVFYAIHSVLSSFTIILTGKREMVALFYVFLVICDLYTTVALSHRDVGWSAVCDCGIS